MKELILDNQTLIVSKTDLNGNIMYCNESFLQYAEYDEEEVLFRPHNIVRYKDMPKSVFKILWSNIRNGKEVFAFIKNRSKFDNYYWVFANVTASYDFNGNIIGYYSVRRKPNPNAISFIADFYHKVLEIEKTQGIQEAYDFILKQTTKNKISYNHFIIDLQRE